MKKKSIVTKSRKPTMLEGITAAVAQEHAHYHSLRLMSDRRILAFSLSEVEGELIALKSAAEKARGRRAVLIAKIDGLSQVLVKRG